MKQMKQLKAQNLRHPKDHPRGKPYTLPIRRRGVNWRDEGRKWRKCALIPSRRLRSGHHKAVDQHDDQRHSKHDRQQAAKQPDPIRRVNRLGFVFVVFHGRSVRILFRRGSGRIGRGLILPRRTAMVSNCGRSRVLSTEYAVPGTIVVSDDVPDALKSIRLRTGQSEQAKWPIKYRHREFPLLAPV